MGYISSNKNKPFRIVHVVWTETQHYNLLIAFLFFPVCQGFGVLRCAFLQTGCWQWEGRHSSPHRCSLGLSRDHWSALAKWGKPRNSEPDERDFPTVCIEFQGIPLCLPAWFPSDATPQRWRCSIAKGVSLLKRKCVFYSEEERSHFNSSSRNTLCGIEHELVNGYF